MPAVVPYNSPQEAAKALVRDHAKAKYNIEDADPLTLLVDFMYDTELSPELRFKATQTALKYTYTEVKSSHVEHSGTVDHRHEVEVEKAIKDCHDFMAHMREERMRLVKHESNVIELNPEQADLPSDPVAS